MGIDGCPLDDYWHISCMVYTGMTYLQNSSCFYRVNRSTPSKISDFLEIFGRNRPILKLKVASPYPGVYIREAGCIFRVYIIFSNILSIS